MVHLCIRLATKVSTSDGLVGISQRVAEAYCGLNPFRRWNLRVALHLRRRTIVVQESRFVQGLKVVQSWYKQVVLTIHTSPVGG